MTTYTPYPKVIFDGGIEYADNTISSISINIGRSNIYEQPKPSFASIELFGDVDTPLSVELAQSVTIQIQKSDTTYQSIFVGQITDLDISISQYGEIGNIVVYRITALGALSLLNKHLAGEFGYSKEFDGTRVYNILSEAFIQSYDEVSPSLRYSQVPASVTFNSYDGATAPIINTLDTNISVPGTYELTAYADGVTNALTLAQNAAQSGRGLLYEGNDGSLYYDDYAKRATYSPLTLTANDIEAENLSTNSQWAEIVNDVTVTFKNGQEANARDGESQLIYGQLSGSKDTQLENGLDAQAQADDYLAARAYPLIYPASITIPLHSPTITNATRDALIGILVSRPIYTNELPAVFGTEFNGFIEGMTWQLTRYTARLTLTCSAVTETYPRIIWLQVPPNQTWAEYNPNIQWRDL